MRVYSLTLDTQPFYETKGKTHFERIIDWFELNDYKLTQNAVNNIYKYNKVNTIFNFRFR